MLLQTVPSGYLSVNTYIIAADGAESCAVIDPGGAEEVLAALNQTGLPCTHILITHGHFDHIGGVKELAAKTGAVVCIHALDAHMLKSNRGNLSVLTGQLLPKTEPDLLLNDGDVIEAAGLTIDVLHTPGHSAGGVCYVLENERVIFCGDTVFLDGVGRTDFPGCSQTVLYHSIADKLFALPGDYRLYPGHDLPTTMEHERQNNPLTLLGKRLNW